jgi:hypothetical protein
MAELTVTLDRVNHDGKLINNGKPEEWFGEEKYPIFYTSGVHAID